jgi:hypothetical protein
MRRQRQPALRVHAQAFALDAATARTQQSAMGIVSQ